MNRAGSVDQKPLYGCTNCAEDYSWPAVDLAVYQGECWCENCWDELRWDGDLPYWSDLDDFVPEHEKQLQAERERVRVLRSALFALVNEGQWVAGEWQADERAWAQADAAIQATAPEQEGE